jgi:hypothetical protein
MLLKGNIWKYDPGRLNVNQKKDCEAILTENADVKARSLTAGKEEHLIIIGVSIHQEDTNIPNLHSPNNVASKKKKQAFKIYRFEQQS